MTRNKEGITCIIQMSGVPSICDALRDLVTFVQFEKHPWRSVTFSKVAG